MKSVLVSLAVLCSIATSQVLITSTVPADNATNVPLSTTLVIVFNTAVDTIGLKGEDWVFSNIDSGDTYFSANAETLYAAVQLDPNTPYFVAILFARDANNAILEHPQVFRFTTGGSFPSATVSGTISSGKTGVTFEDAMVTLSIAPFDEGKEGPPPFIAWANVNTDGSFTIPYVPNGTYWPLAVKDVDHNGKLDGNYPDVFAFGDSIVVTGPVTGVTLTFDRPEPIPYADALHEADSIKAASISADYVLKQVTANNIDTAGQVMDWQFAYVSTDTMRGYIVHVGFGEHSCKEIDDLNWLSWLYDWVKPLPNPAQAVDPATAILSVENGGGKNFRKRTPPVNSEFGIQAQLCDQTRSQFHQIVPDTTKAYWGIVYQFGYETDTSGWQSVLQESYLCDASTGALIGIVTDVQHASSRVPATFVLQQNYPNPFNPSTTIAYEIPRDGLVTLKVYDAIGREVATLVNGMMSSGRHVSTFDAGRLATGLYFSIMNYQGERQIRKMMLVR